MATLLKALNELIHTDLFKTRMEALGMTIPAAVEQPAIRATGTSRCRRTVLLALAGDDANEFARLANQARQLMMPGEMGERFKAMAWLRGLNLRLSGFALQDLRHTL